MLYRVRNQEWIYNSMVEILSDSTTAIESVDSTAQDMPQHNTRRAQLYLHAQLYV